MKNKIKKYLRWEIDVEFFSCVHAVAMIFLYGFELYIDGVESMSFAVIFQIMVLGYVCSWLQKMLFFKEKLYTIWEYRIRAFLWILEPVVLAFITGRLAGWYKGRTPWVELVFMISLFLYYFMLWSVIQIFYEGESEYLNELLNNYKINNKAGKDSGNGEEYGDYHNQ